MYLLNSISSISHTRIIKQHLSSFKILNARFDIPSYLNKYLLLWMKTEIDKQLHQPNILSGPVIRPNSTREFNLS